jgi:hypothetical protein
MKKFLLGLLLTFLIATPVYGYNVVKGDTPFGLWGINWKTELAKYGISDPTKLPVGLEVNEQKLGATPTPTSSANRKYVESPDFYLYSPAVSLDTTITLNTLKDIYGNILTMTDLGTLGYGRIDPDSASISESITFSGITANSDGTYTLTGVKSALAKYPYTQTSGLKRSHSINAIFRLTNTAAFYDGFANKENGEIIEGIWTYNQFPIVSSSTALPTNNGQLATKYYVDTVGAGGFTSANVSTTRGLYATGSSPEKVGINASSTTGMTFDSSGKLYQAIGNALTYTGNAIAVSTSTIVSQIATSTPTANAIPMATVSGTIPVTWMATSTISGQILRSTSTGSFWDDIGSSVVTTTGHSLGVVYTNNSTRTKLVIVSVTFNISGGGDQNLTSVASIHSSSLATTTVASIGARANNVTTNAFTITPSMTFIVPRGFDYTVVGGSSLVSWSEMEL